MIFSLKTRKTTTFLCILSLSYSIFAQSSEKYTSRYADFYRAQELFAKQHYGAAREKFQQFSEKNNEINDPLYIKARYYEAISALELYNNDAVSLLKQFLLDYPESIYKHTINFRIGNSYYREKKYVEALSYYSKFWVRDLEDDFFDEYYFKVGYANFQIGNIDEARSAFVEIKDHQSQYSSAGLYYFSHITYTDKNYQTALNGFLKLEEDENFGKIVPYYILQIYYLQHRYQEVVDYAPKVDRASLINQQDVNRLIGDSYYRIERYDEAVSYLEKYNQLSQGSREDDYQLGYAYFKSGNYQSAIRLLDRTIQQHTDSLSQVALYHIGESYLNLQNNESARIAFQKAFEINADTKIQEDALYQFAVLSYKVEIDPYNESILAFETFLNNYPYSRRKDEVYQYLINVYTITNNYKNALNSLERIENKDFVIRKIYQQIAYNYGIELFQKGEYISSINTLGLVQKYPIDPSISAKAYYWIADANYFLENYRNSVEGYKNYLRMPGATSPELKTDAYYNIAYAYLQLYDTTSAIENFRIYIQQNSVNKDKLADSYMRLADAYFMEKDNLQAIHYYDLALKTGVTNQDQALYYKALTHGVTNDKESKIASLLNLVNNYSHSKYIQDALYEIAFTYKIVPDYPNAIRYFQQLLNDYPNTNKEAIARVEMADSYYKQYNYKQAEVEYLIVLEKFGHDTICSAVGDGLQHVYAATKQIEKLEHYANIYPCLNINSLTLENLIYNPAETDYFAKKYTQTIPKLVQYLEKYPEGYHAKKALAYLADSYYELDSLQQSVFRYQELLSQANSNYTELAAVRVARYYYNNKDFQQAIPYYQRTELVSADPEILFNAQLGLMRSFYHTKQFDFAAIYANQIIANNLLKPENRIEAHYILGISNFEINKYAEAIQALNFVSNNTTKSIAAEAKFTIAQIHFHNKELEQANNTIRELLKMKPVYDFWIAKGLILQTQILIKQNDLFQAEQTISSVIEHYPKNDDGIKDEAQYVYQELMSLKLKPKQVVPQTNPEIEIINK